MTTVLEFPLTPDYTAHPYTLQSFHSLSQMLHHFILPFYAGCPLALTVSMQVYHCHLTFIHSLQMTKAISRCCVSPSPSFHKYKLLTIHDKPSIYSFFTLIIHSVHTTSISQITYFQCLGPTFVPSSRRLKNNNNKQPQQKPGKRGQCFTDS